MELCGTGPLRGRQSLIALITISSAILTKGCVGNCKKVFHHTNITTHLDHPVIWHGSGMSPRFSQLDQGIGQGEIWKLALSLNKFQIWDGHYSNKTNYSLTFNTSSVQFSHSVVSDSFQPHESQHARPPCPSPTPRVHSDSCPSSQWCHPAISSSVVPFSSFPQSLPASGSFPMSQLFTWGGQSIRVSALASVLPRNTQDWSPSEWTGWISLQSKGLSRVFSNTTVQNHQFFCAQLSL